MSPMQKIVSPATEDLTPPTRDPRQDGAIDVSAEFRAQIGRYQLLRLLGRGGMGSVYLAHDAQLDRDVALKIPHFRAEQGEMMERFSREARAAGRLQHPNICTVYEVG